MYSLHLLFYHICIVPCSTIFENLKHIDLLFYAIYNKSSISGIEKPNTPDTNTDLSSNPAKCISLCWKIPAKNYTGYSVPDFYDSFKTHDWAPIKRRYKVEGNISPRIDNNNESVRSPVKILRTARHFLRAYLSAALGVRVFPISAENRWLLLLEDFIRFNFDAWL